MLEKLVGHLLLPLDAALAAGLLAIVLGLLKRPRAALAAGLASLVTLWAASTPAVADALAGPLERRFPPLPVEESPRAEAIVVLGGALAPRLPPRTEAELVDASDRVLHAARLYQAGKAPLVVPSGGELPWSAAPEPEAAAMTALLVEWGVPRDAILPEPRGATTRENAVDTEKLLLARGVRRVLLVTSSLHMPRAVAAFSVTRLTVIPSACDVSVVKGRSSSPLRWIPAPDALALTHAALWERLGFLWYRLRGWA